MSDQILQTSDQATTPVYALSEADLEGYLATAPDFLKGFAAQNDFKARSGQVLSSPAADGTVDRILFGVGAGTDPTVFRGLAAKLPAGDYALKTYPASLNLDDIVLAFGLVRDGQAIVGTAPAVLWVAVARMLGSLGGRALRLCPLSLTCARSAPAPRRHSRAALPPRPARRGRAGR